jgi:ABC-type nitrate/sulfonate/bicarbonate transport system substrate-binding protein
MLIATIFSLIIVQTSCKSESKENEIDKVTFVLDWIPNTNHTGIYTAIEKGYFKDENIEVEVIQPSEDTAETLVASGQGEFGISFQETVTTARTTDNPIPVVAIAAVLQHNTSGFAALSDKNINSPKDFEGKTYGSWGTNIETAFIKTVMQKENADFNKLDVVDISSYDFLTSIKNDVDFQWIYYGWDGIAAEVLEEDISFIKLQDIASELDFYTPVIITSEDLTEKDPELIKRFLKATTKGYEYAIENPEDAVKDLLKHAPETDEKIAKASQLYLADEYISDADYFGEMDEEIWVTFSKWMYENKVIEKELDIEKAYTNEFLPGAN